MKQPETKNTNSRSGLTRRNLFKVAGAGGLAIAAGASTVSLFSCTKERSLHVVAWSHFIKEADELMKGAITEEFKKASGITLKYETINANDLPARATAAVESGTGPDVFQLQ
ncbi:MAG TPA: hypothetical protein VGC20_02280, partial [bacterium]